MLTENLREQTKSYHQQTEVALVSRIRNINTEADYANLLKIFYGYFGGLEKSIDNAIDLNQMPDHAQRRKTSALVADLHALNAEIPELASEAELPKLNNHPQALGALYVIEGSTLGGKIISKMIAQKLALPENKALSFFNGYGAETEKMWASFKELLNSQAKTNADEATVIAAANDTFLQFKNWIQQHS